VKDEYSGIKMLKKCEAFFKSGWNSFGCRANSPSNDKNTNQFRRSAMSVHSPAMAYAETFHGGFHSAA